jgi:DNA mismatch repair ATPase MutS
MLHHATSRSLLLIDEFGKGTNATDGVALLAALIKKLAIPPSPKVLITLHFLEIFRQGLLGNAMDEASPGSCGLPGVMAFCMEMHISNDEGGKPVPLFKLKPGVAKSSHGIACAKEGGLDEAVLQRAKELLPLVEAGQPLTLRNDALPPLQHPAVLQALGAFLARAAAPEGATWTSASEEDVEEMYNLVQAIPHVDRIRRKERNGEHSGDAAPLG